VIDAAYDTLPATGFCAETRAQPLAADLNLPAEYFRRGENLNQLLA
jgi:hypothetical protein